MKFFLKDVIVNWRALSVVLAKYAKEYGGIRGVFASPFFHMSVLFAIMGAQFWKELRWLDIALGLIPNLLGLSIGTYGILFSLLGDKLRKALLENFEPSRDCRRPKLLRKCSNDK